MRDEQQFEQLMLQYNQLKTGAEDIAKMIDKEDYDGAITMIKLREPLFLNCKCIRRYLELTPEQEKQLNVVLDELKNLEQQNIKTLTANLEKVKEELQLTQKTEKIQQAYEFEENNLGNIVNIKE